MDLYHVQTRYTTADEEKMEGEGVETSLEVDTGISERNRSSLQTPRTIVLPSIALSTFVFSFRHEFPLFGPQRKRNAHTEAQQFTLTPIFAEPQQCLREFRKSPEASNTRNLTGKASFVRLGVREQHS